MTKQQQISKDDYITEDELSALWGIKKNTLQKWRSNGVGPVYIKRVGRVVYHKAALVDYERNNCFQGSDSRVSPDVADKFINSSALATTRR